MEKCVQTVFLTQPVYLKIGRIVVVLPRTVEFHPDKSTLLERLHFADCIGTIKIDTPAINENIAIACSGVLHEFHIVHPRKHESHRVVAAVGLHHLLHPGFCAATVNM